MSCTLTKVGPGQLFALIGFVPGPLGEYLDRMRQQLVSNCPLKSHVSLLPPRFLNAAAGELSDVLRARLETVKPFEISLGDVEVFPGTGVVFLGIKSGLEDLLQAHEFLSQEEFAYPEPYSFHPHVTLAQDFPQPESGELEQRARRLWNSWKGDRSFLLDRVSFVRGADLCTWETVSEHELSRSRRLKTA